MSDSFGDSTPDDTFTVGDDKIDMSHIEELDDQIISIEGVENDAERLEMAKVWASELETDN